MAKLDDRLQALATMSPAHLRDCWRQFQRSEPPRWGPDLLRFAIGYHLQERAQGAASAAQLRELRRIGVGRLASDAPQLKPGTRLLRSWHGRTISVLVTEAGYLFEDRAYGSLTAIAKEVTGAAWSGPRFFGLKEANRG
jgi:hypothetical protein